MKTLYLAWQDPKDRGWFPVGSLSTDGHVFRFAYLRGAERARDEAGFSPLQSFPRFDTVYESDQLFPFFSNRVPPTARPDFADFVQWLNVPADKDDPVVLLSRSGGRRETDTLEMFPCPDLNEEGCYHIHFFVHGLRYVSAESLKRIETLHSGERLLLMHDFQNEHDSSALLLRTNDLIRGDRHIVGYLPRYLTGDAFNLVKRCPNPPKVTVERVNKAPAPLQLRLLCNLTGCWPDRGFRPCDGRDFFPIVSVDSEAATT